MKAAIVKFSELTRTNQGGFSNWTAGHFLGHSDELKAKHARAIQRLKAALTAVRNVEAEIEEDKARVKQLMAEGRVQWIAGYPYPEDANEQQRGNE